MVKNLDRITQSVERLERIALNAAQILSVLQAIDEFEESKTPAEEAVDDGLPPREHPMLIRAYNPFFRTVRSSLLRDLHMQVAKLLLENNDSLHVNMLLRFASPGKEAAKIRRAMQALSSDERERERYWSFREVDSERRARIAEHAASCEHLILKLALVRNRRLGHEDKRAEEPNMLEFPELKALIELADEVIEAVRMTYFGVPNSGYPHYPEDYRRRTKDMLDKLYSTY